MMFVNMSNRYDVSKEIFNKMMEIAGYKERFEDMVLEKDEWYLRYTWTKAKRDEWYDWGVKLIMKKLKMNKKYAESQMSWFDLAYGLKEV